MNEQKKHRRDFLKTTTVTAAGLTLSSLLPRPARAQKSRIRFSVIGLNHGHITGQTRAVLRGGGELVSFYAKEPDLIAGFQRQFPQAKLARSEQEIL
jgi:Ni,Fe-hydrogenase I small subunit